MKVSDLVGLLIRCDPETMVLTRGYETGYIEVDSVEEIYVTKATDPHWWDGDYDKIIDDSSVVLPAIFIRGSRNI